MKTSSLFILALLSAVVNAKNGYIAALQSACNTLTSSYKWECPEQYSKTTTSTGKGGRGKSTGSSTTCNCWSPEYLASYIDCATRAKVHKSEEVLQLLLATCNVATIRPDLTRDDLTSIYENATDYFVDIADVNTNKTITSPVKFTQTSIDLNVRVNKASSFSSYSGKLYGGILLAYFAGVMAIGTFINWFKILFPKYSKTAANYGPVRFVRQKFANPAMFGFRNGLSFKWGPYNIVNMSIPTRTQSWVIIGYIVTFIILMFIRYDIFKENTRFKTRHIQLARYVADRSGEICIAQMPLLYLYASRNNIAMIFTGWSYDTMNAYHRWIARVTVMAVFIHSVAYTDYYRLNGGLAKEWSRPFVVWGIVGTICGALLCFFSLRYFREYLYEFFLYCHWALVAFFTIGTWYHLPHTHAKKDWIYATVAVWAFDRAARLGRIVLNGLHASAEVELVGNEFIRTKVSYFRFWKPLPGHYVFIHWLLPVWRCWENHPFTIYQSPVAGEEKNFIIVTKIEKGKTKQMAEYLSKKGGKVKMPVFIDGPYGHTFPVGHCDTIILMAGGIGFTGAYSYVDKLKTQAGKKHIVFLWAVRTHQQVEVFKNEVEFMNRSGFDVQLYISDENASAQDSLKEKEGSGESAGESADNEKASIGSETSATINYGVLDVNSTVENYINEAPGSIGFFICGPPGLNDAVRANVSKHMHKGKGAVEVFVEGFSW